MNSDSFDRQWQYLRGELKAWWDQLTDAALEQVAGKKAQLVALVQEESTKNWGLRYPGLFLLHGKIGVPPSKHRTQLAVERLDPCLQ
jgi:uncharacterized protein YjbJ (UPF0337 family)